MRYHSQIEIILNLCRRKLLQASVSCLCSEADFSAVDELSLETLTEMMQSCKHLTSIIYMSYLIHLFFAVLTELGHSSRLYCELSARVVHIFFT